MGEVGRAIIGPGEIAADDILGPLKPFEADHSRRCRLGATRFYRAPSKSIDLFPRGRGLRLQSSPLLRHSLPGIGYRLVEELRVKSVDNAPSMAAHRYHFFPLAQPRPARAIDDDRIYFVRRARRDGADRAVGDFVPLFCHDIADQVHDTFIVWACAAGHALAASLGFQILSEQPINRAVTYELSGFDRAGF